MAKRTWAARMGAWGLAFFVVKGIGWLVVPALLAYLTR